MPVASQKTQTITMICQHESFFMTKRVGRKRLSIDIPTLIRERMDIIVKRRNITITKFILQAILEKLRTEQFYE